MAYSPIEQGRMLGNRALAEVAARHGATPAQVALAWLLRQDGMMVIPKATKAEHVRENFAALKLRLTATTSRRSTAPSRPPKAPPPWECCSIFSAVPAKAVPICRASFETPASRAPQDDDFFNAI